MRMRYGHLILPLCFLLGASAAAQDNAPMPGSQGGSGGHDHGSNAMMGGGSMCGSGGCGGMGGMNHGGDTMKSHHEHHFKSSDSNGDGKLTVDEMQAHAKAMHGKMDANKDGGVTLQEMLDHHAHPGAGGHGGHGGHSNH